MDILLVALSCCILIIVISSLLETSQERYLSMIEVISDIMVSYDLHQFDFVSKNKEFHIKFDEDIVSGFTRYTVYKSITIIINNESVSKIHKFTDEYYRSHIFMETIKDRQQDEVKQLVKDAYKAVKKFKKERHKKITTELKVNSFYSSKH